MFDIYSLFDRKITSDFRPHKIRGGFLVRVKRSKYLTKIPLKPNEEIAYLSGVIAGDGSFKVSKRPGIAYPRAVITITNKSKRLLNYINVLLERNFKYQAKIYRYNTRNVYDMQISNRIIFLYFRRAIKMPIDKSKLKIPRLFSGKRLLKFFTAGIFDTDGYYSRNIFGIMMSGRNYRFLAQMKKGLSNEYGISFGKITRNTLYARGKTYYRASMVLRAKSRNDFWKTIPIQHEKYGPGRNRTGGFHRVKVPQNQRALAF